MRHALQALYAFSVEPVQPALHRMARDTQGCVDFGNGLAVLEMCQLSLPDEYFPLEGKFFRHDLAMGTRVFLIPSLPLPAYHAVNQALCAEAIITTAYSAGINGHGVPLPISRTIQKSDIRDRPVVAKPVLQATGTFDPLQPFRRIS